jgi:DNA-binding CsgD family transcriptional regulator
MIGERLLLTKREQEVWNLRRQGYSYFNIAQNLGITEKTAKAFVHRILVKRGFNSSLELASSEYEAEISTLKAKLEGQCAVYF